MLVLRCWSAAASWEVRADDDRGRVRRSELEGGYSCFGRDGSRALALPVLLSLLSEVVRLLATRGVRLGVAGEYWSEKGFEWWKLEVVGLAEGGGVRESLWLVLLEAERGALSLLRCFMPLPLPALLLDLLY